MAPVLCGRDSYVGVERSKLSVHKILIRHAGRIMAPPRLDPLDRDKAIKSSILADALSLDRRL